MSAEVVLRGAVSLGAILALAGGGIAFVEGVRHRPLLRSVLVQRWFTWALLAPAWLAAAAWAPARVALLTTFSLIAVMEFTRLRTSLVAVDRWLLMAWGIAAVPLIALSGMDPMVVVAAAALSSLAMPLLSADVRNGPRRVGDLCFGILIVVLPFVLLHEVVAATSGSLFFAIGLAIALSDVTAFVAGSTLGRRRLAPSLSPNKTYAGVAGNFLGAALGVAIASLVGIAPWSAVWLAPLIGAGAIVGDLTISLLKRSRGVKDTGAWLPGFGGLLDRVDSLLAAAPIAFIAISLIGGPA
jgi:phosphatidate cytidylyltransferase